jgi:hypothetical protein
MNLSVETAKTGYWLIPIEQQIQQRTYELYEQRGRIQGRDLEDWLQAERKIKGTQTNVAAA